MKCFIDVKGESIPSHIHEIIANDYYKQGCVDVINSVLGAILLGADSKKLMEDLRCWRSEIKMTK